MSIMQTICNEPHTVLPILRRKERMSDTDAYKVKCKNCMACEQHDTRFWCDFWATEIFDINEAFCSCFTPHSPMEEEE